jgi:hypothetical protein
MANGSSREDSAVGKNLGCVSLASLFNYRPDEIGFPPLAELREHAPRREKCNEQSSPTPAGGNAKCSNHRGCHGSAGGKGSHATSANGDKKREYRARKRTREHVRLRR